MWFAQEVPPGGFDELREAVDAADGAWAWHEQDGKDAATATGAALLTRDPWTLSDAGMLADAPSLKRAMAATAVNARTGQRVAVLSAALPPGGVEQGQSPRPGSDPWGERKAEQARVIAAWIARRRQEGLPVLVGIDANAPRVDPPDWHQVVYWWDDEALLLGPDAVAGDVYRRWLAEHPDEQARITVTHPDGPLATTHLRGGSTPCRYDHLLATDDIAVDGVDHVTDPAFTAGSDHGIVQAQLRLPNTPREAGQPSTGDISSSGSGTRRPGRPRPA